MDGSSASSAGRRQRLEGIRAGQGRGPRPRFCAGERSPRRSCARPSLSPSASRIRGNERSKPAASDRPHPDFGSEAGRGAAARFELWPSRRIEHSENAVDGNECKGLAAARAHSFDSLTASSLRWFPTRTEPASRPDRDRLTRGAGERAHKLALCVVASSPEPPPERHPEHPEFGRVCRGRSIARLSLSTFCNPRTKGLLSAHLFLWRGCALRERRCSGPRTANGIMTTAAFAVRICRVLSPPLRAPVEGGAQSRGRHRASPPPACPFAHFDRPPSSGVARTGRLKRARGGGQMAGLTRILLSFETERHVNDAVRMRPGGSWARPPETNGGRSKPKNRLWPFACQPATFRGMLMKPSAARMRASRGGWSRGPSPRSRTTSPSSTSA